ncbi:hypothetical protein [[Clostridium] hylemonae]|uniref:Zn-finger containing protein n=1 Tax=[Clostridium] hylemonae DSM 15053 TaxID=553973 RepID=C0C5L3_9FIRM|nr:hypothetical protein [[Clostridium] hylemonae]EEG72397.1 hypothetical protein CLOHYLEM_07400 [[Clostridium] hylemonae DSM 15053]QEK16576.1 hypothetical protein LAJLEIBI_00577 [[Clostridium] hylemonae DSM 15053]
MKEKFIRFMSGRYGIDSFGKFTLILGVAALILSGWFDSFIFSVLAWVCVIYSYFRIFSRNVYKRAAENQTWLNKTYKVRSWFARQKNSASQRKVYHIYKCPSCRQKIRIPKGKGKIEVRCPKCSTTFIKNS